MARKRDRVATACRGHCFIDVIWRRKEDLAKEKRSKLRKIKVKCLAPG